MSLRKGKRLFKKEKKFKEKEKSACRMADYRFL
jgi:hypothetical protein